MVIDSARRLCLFWGNFDPDLESLWLGVGAANVFTSELTVERGTPGTVRFTTITKQGILLIVRPKAGLPTSREYKVTYCDLPSSP